MKCPYCSSPRTKVIDKRDGEDLTVTRRRRRCATCGARFTTYERSELVSLIVVKKDGRREEFSRAKLRAGVTKACAKRPVSAATIEQLVNEVEAELPRHEGPEVNHTVIGELVMQKLREVDHVAYIRFASVYRAFADLTSFEEEIARAKRSALRGQPPAQGPDLTSGQTRQPLIVER
ncbi:MAG: transcriptional repressor NrdR [Chloroflexi bacterium]|nr:transcriptional repressor NrdR [Chloroflexota bacterium]